ncbi:MULTISPECIES: hypothetical protein [Streptomyces]|uniref:hypothetical protein n=1 Tax=Streptomyces TaxID=1883 RepID=UPI001E45E2B0|nr:MULTISPECIES: hypothetical protein [Streptomyces]UFQ15417.1 hypothetical protein J2N69_10660 [Streptomyces huasconensis]WCL85021.1 hypothetical protein PPN52_10670 [Streptomyces sp. JCM 35825]
MIWWLRARGLGAVAAVLAGTVVLGSLIGNAELPVPALAGQSGTFLVGHIITLLPAVVLLNGMGRGDLHAESVACRAIQSRDALLGGAVAVTGLAVGAVGHLVWSSGLMLVLGRNITIYVGLALMFRIVMGHRVAGTVLAVIPLLCAAAGWRSGGRPQPGAWILYPASSLTALAASCAVLAVGMLATARRRPSLRD